MMIDVKDFGVVGDGIADDTLAIQSAVDMANTGLRARQPTGGSMQGGQPTVYFPSGKYRITAPIKFNGFACVVGEGSVVIQEATVADVFTFVPASPTVLSGCYRNRIRGMNFCGGARQLVFANGNVDLTMLSVKDCTFQGWSDVAVYAQATTGDLHMSASLILDHCIWDGGHGLLTRCDYTEVRNSVVLFRGATITDGTKWAKSLYTNGMLRITGSVMTPRPPQIDGRNAKCYWVDNAGSFVTDTTRYGGENGGLPIVRHISGPNLVNPWRGQLVSIQNCQANCGKDADPDAGIVTLDNGLPQCIQISGCNGLVSNSIPVVRVAPGYDLQAAVNSITTTAGPSAGMYSVTIKGNQFYTPQPIPAPLTPFVK